MSAANISPDPKETAQQNYDYLISSIGMNNAPVEMQLSALRSLSPEEMINLMGLRHTFMIEDEEFFVDYSGERFDQPTALPSWVKAVVIGKTKEETAFFAHKWHAMTADEMRSDWERHHADPAYAQEVFAAYGVTKESSQSSMIAAVVACTSDAFFDTTTNAIATKHLENPSPANPKVYQYSFDQPDVLSTRSVFCGSVYHSLDIAFLFRHPQIVGPDAPNDFRITSDVFSDAALKLVNDKEPWEEVSVAKRWNLIHADRTEMKSQEDGSAARWRKLADTPERHQKFMRSMMLLSDAMGYAMEVFSS